MSFIDMRFDTDPIEVIRYLDARGIYAYAIDISPRISSVVLSSSDTIALSSYLISVGSTFLPIEVTVVTYVPGERGILELLSRYPDARYVREGFNNTLILES